jgi:hypothetical protein
MMRSQSEVNRDLDTICDILGPLNDDGREGVLAAILWWFLAHYPDRQSALAHLLARAEDIEREVEGEALQ